jgi:hypothetical protein
MRSAGHAEGVGERRNAYRTLVRKSEEKRPLGKPRLKLKGDIKMAVQEMGLGASSALIRLRIRSGGRLL